MKIFRASETSHFFAPSSVSPGTVLVDQGKLYAKDSDGWLEILSLQLAGKKSMDASEFLRGFRHDEEPLLLVLAIM